MTLPASGPISLADIQTEFGGTNPISINEYYRGGAFVPVIASTSGIPASGQISLNQFYGKSFVTVSLPASLDLSVSGSNGTGVTCRISFSGTTSTSGMIFRSNAGSDPTQVATWATPTGVAIGSYYEWQWETVSGSVTTGTAGVLFPNWQSFLSSSFIQTSPGAFSNTIVSTGIIRVRRTGDLVVVGTTNVTLSATSS